MSELRSEKPPTECPLLAQRRHWGVARQLMSAFKGKAGHVIGTVVTSSID